MILKNKKKCIEIYRIEEIDLVTWTVAMIVMRKIQVQECMQQEGVQDYNIE